MKQVDKRPSIHKFIPLDHEEHRALIHLLSWDLPESGIVPPQQTKTVTIATLSNTFHHCHGYLIIHVIGNQHSAMEVPLKSWS